MAEKKEIVAGRPGALKEAVEYVSKPWFPVNVEVLHGIQEKLQLGLYNDDKTALLQDLKKDFSLLTYCLKSLKGVLGDQKSDLNPTDFLISLDIETLKGILSKSEDEISMHKFDANVKTQVQRLKHSLISSTSVELMANKSSLNPDLAFSMAQVRQLGLALVAWNYPRIYAKAISALKGGEDDLDNLLVKILGYHPRQLGFCVALDWNTSPEVVEASGFLSFEPSVDDQATGFYAPKEANTNAKKITTLCEIGESLAKVSDDSMPKFPNEWDSVVQNINNILGPSGLHLIKEKLNQNASGYISLNGEIFGKSDFIPERVAKPASPQITNKLFSDNIYIKKCPQLLQEKFRAAYAQILGNQISINALALLVGDVVPAAGFTQGCIYLVDERKDLIVPTIKIGNISLTKYKALGCTSGGSATHPVVEALSYTSPIVQEQVYLNGELVSHVTGAFGNNQKSGVIYLEMSEDLLKTDRNIVLMYFKAIRHALNDTLALK